MPFINNAKVMLLASSKTLKTEPFSILADTIIAALMRTSFTEVIDAQTTFSSISTYEIVATGYTAFGNGNSLLSKAVAVDAANDRAEFDAADFTYTAIGGAANNEFDYVTLARASADNTEATANTLASVAVTSTLTNGGDITLQWNAEGILQVTS